MLSVYVLNNTALNYVRQNHMELQRKIYDSNATVGDFNTLSEMNRSSRQNISKDIIDLNSTINQLDIIDSYKLFYLNRRIHILLKLTWSIQ